MSQLINEATEYYGGHVNLPLTLTEELPSPVTYDADKDTVAYKVPYLIQ